MRKCICVHCGQGFETRSGKATLCGDACRRGWHNAKTKAYYAANRERVRTVITAWRGANRERMRATDKAYREANRARLNAENKVYREKNAKRLRAQQKHRRRLQRLKAAQTAPRVGDDDER
jgi:hypothetical protein